MSIPNVNNRPARKLNLRMQVREGFLDGLAYANVPREYDTWRSDRQRNYEKGRLLAAQLKAETHTYPKWRKNTWVPTGLDEGGYDALNTRTLSTSPFTPLPVPSIDDL